MLSNYRATETPNMVEGPTLRPLFHDYQLNTRLGNHGNKYLDSNWLVDPNPSVFMLVLLVVADWFAVLFALMDKGWRSVVLVLIGAVLFSEVYSLVRRTVYDVVPMGMVYGQMYIGGFLLGYAITNFKKLFNSLVALMVFGYLTFSNIYQWIESEFDAMTTLKNSRNETVFYDDHFGKILALILGLGTFFVRPILF